jgi:hypothetical protein
MYATTPAGSTIPPIAIEDHSRVTPMPAGEAFVARRMVPASLANKRWWLLGGATVAVSLAAILILVTRSSADEAKPAPKPAKPVVEVPELDKRVPQPNTPATDTADSKDGEEVAAINDPSGPPVAGEGPCKLEVSTNPAGSMVQLDGQTVGPSPITIAGPCSRRRVDVAHPRYKPELRWVTLAADKANTLDITLVRPTHDITVTSNPSGATVSIGGRRAGTTPTRVQLMGFSGIDVTIEKPGFETITKRVYSKKPNDALAVSLKRSLWLKK